MSRYSEDFDAIVFDELEPRTMLTAVAGPVVVAIPDPVQATYVTPVTPGSNGSGTNSTTNTVVGRTITVKAGTDLRTILATARSGDTFVLAAGVFLVDPRTPIVLPDNVTIQGAGASTIIRVKDGVGNFVSLFGGNSGTLVIKNFTLRNLSIDMNTAKYGGTPTQANPACALLAWQCNGITVDSVHFTYGGVTCVEISGTATSAMNVTVTNSTFTWSRVGTKTYDNSAVYIEAYNQTVTNNTFYAPAGTGAATAIELHGGPAVAKNNVITGFGGGVNVVCSNGIQAGSPSGSMLVQGNTITGANFGVLFWSDPGMTLRNVTVTGNTIRLSNADWNQYWSAGVAPMPSETGTYDTLTVTNNSITFQSTTSTTFSPILTQGVDFITSGIVKNCVASNNSVINLPTRK